MAVDIQKTFDWDAVRFAEYNQADWDKFYGSSECPRFGIVKNARLVWKQDSPELSTMKKRLMEVKR